MAGRPKICICCGEKIGANEASVPYKGRTAHQKCFNVAIKTLQKDKQDKLETTGKKRGRKPKPKAELKDNVSEEEYKKKKAFYDYVRLIVKDELSAKVYALAEDYIKKYNFTFESMHKTLIYLNEIICKDLTGDGVGLIPYYHTEAQKYFEEINIIEQANRDIDVSKMYKTKKIIIQPKQRIINQLDIETIGKE